ncbi:uncharacterized protein LOC142351457 isoform X1 [Convolutriloba macropyga]|uniref:uncharacterized protein LOC142351457 isoform X1 n=1 Tax=Convolutriloba macropyga TaxID=536237 RepID=UPI003F525FB0
MSYSRALNSNNYQGLIELGGSALNKSYGYSGGVNAMGTSTAGGVNNVGTGVASLCCGHGSDGCGNPNVTICHCCRLIFATNQSHLIDEHLSSKIHKKNMLLYLLGELQKTAAEVQRLKGLLAELQADVDIQEIKPPKTITQTTPVTSEADPILAADEQSNISCPCTPNSTKQKYQKTANSSFQRARSAGTNNKSKKNSANNKNNNNNRCCRSCLDRGDTSRDRIDNSCCCCRCGTSFDISYQDLNGDEDDDEEEESENIGDDANETYDCGGQNYPPQAVPPSTVPITSRRPITSAVSNLAAAGAGNANRNYGGSRPRSRPWVCLCDEQMPPTSAGGYTTASYCY